MRPPTLCLDPGAPNGQSTYLEENDSRAKGSTSATVWSPGHFQVGLRGRLGFAAPGHKASTPRHTWLASAPHLPIALAYYEPPRGSGLKAALGRCCEGGDQKGESSSDSELVSEDKARTSQQRTFCFSRTRHQMNDMSVLHPARRTEDTSSQRGSERAGASRRAQSRHPQIVLAG